MTQPRYSWERGNVIARCPDCDAVTNFEAKDGNAHYGVTIQNEQHEYQGKTYQRYVWKFLRCAGCGRGAVARVHDTNGQNRHLDVVDVFLPQAIEKAPLPEKVPQDLVKEFREAELCAAHGAYRAGSAMLRSVLEKALLKNGYDEVEFTDDKTGERKKSRSLFHRINAAADDRVITDSRRQRVQENIRVLGNDILHDDYREVAEEEFEEAHHYSQRVLEDLYDHRASVEATLRARGRAFVPADAAAAATS